MRRHRYFLVFLVLLGLVLAGLFAQGRVVQGRAAPLRAQKREVVKTLGLTDLAIWTEARYTRHPSQTDFFTAFQDFPAAPEHFPAGSIVAPSLSIRPEAESR